MSTPAIASLVFAAVILALGVLAIGLCKTAGRATRAEEQRVWDNTTGRWTWLPPGARPAPGQFTVDDLGTTDPLELLYSAPAYDPAFDEGRERLWDAIRDTNTTEGDTTP